MVADAVVEVKSYSNAISKNSGEGPFHQSHCPTAPPDNDHTGMCVEPLDMSTSEADSA